MQRLFLAIALIFSLPASEAAGFTLNSPDISAGKTIPTQYTYNGFGCTGSNVSPALNWHNPPAGTQSFAITVHDPDAPTGGAGWWHWIVINLPATMTGLARGDGTADGSHLPAGAQQIRTDFGTTGWGGPCPPVGDKPHHYHFTVYALKVSHLDVPANATASLAGFMINQAALGKAELVAPYGR